VVTGTGSGARRLLLLDGHSLAYRAFFALPVENFRTRIGQPTNAVYGFTAMLINLLRDEAPTHIAVAFDVSRQTFRSETFAAYKANRTSTPEDFHGQVELIKEVLAANPAFHSERPRPDRRRVERNDRHHSPAPSCGAPVHRQPGHGYRN